MVKLKFVDPPITDIYNSYTTHSRTFEAVRFAFLYALNELNAPAYALLSAQEGWLKRLFKVHILRMCAFTYAPPLVA